MGGPLPKGPCGKVTHPTRTEAIAQVQRLRSLNRTPHPLALRAFYCTRCTGYHIGHSQYLLRKHYPERNPP